MRELEKALKAALHSQIDRLPKHASTAEAAETILKLTQALATLRASKEPQWPLRGS